MYRIRIRRQDILKEMFRIFESNDHVLYGDNK